MATTLAPEALQETEKKQNINDEFIDTTNVEFQSHNDRCFLESLLYNKESETERITVIYLIITIINISTLIVVVVVVVEDQLHVDH